MKQIIIQALDDQMVSALSSLGDDWKATVDGKPNPQSQDDYAMEKLKSAITNYLSSMMSDSITKAVRRKSFDAAKASFVITIQ